MSSSAGFSHYWAQGDAVSHAVAYVLLAMSILSWYLIFTKSWSAWRMRRGTRAADQFWQAPSLDDALNTLRAADPENIYVPIADHAIQAANIPRQDATASDTDSSVASNASLNTDSGRNDAIMRNLRRALTRASSRLENGLTALASIGATAPFVGLFGTVWGIYHALLAVSASGTVQIDKVAGPVGEALIMTALGLVVAIPAVLAYNGFTRTNRITNAELDGFARDLYAHLSTS
ncbi:MAG: MotA/TolQ/ExbB proton channel family protein [Herbaspirillum sp.]